MKKKRKPSETEQESVESLSGEELAMLRAGLQQSNESRGDLPPHKTSDGAYMIRYARKNKLLTVAVAVILVAILAAVAWGIFSFASWLGDRPNRSDFTLILGQNKPETISYRDAVRDGVLYVDEGEVVILLCYPAAKQGEYYSTENALKNIEKDF